LYAQKLLTLIVKAAGAAVVEFIVGQGGLPAGTGGSAPVVPIPAPIETLKGKTTTGTDKNGTPMVTTKCVLPSALLFEPDSSTLLNERDARRALANCIRYKTAKTSVRVEGHTACRNASDSDPTYAKRLSEERARRIVDIVVDLGVPRQNTHIRGFGATRPLVQPCNDPANRATVVTITTPKETAK
jgi:outer membrane protein OmpA-like peptidoglycan-associated protein